MKPKQLPFDFQRTPLPPERRRRIRARSVATRRQQFRLDLPLFESVRPQQSKAAPSRTHASHPMVAKHAVAATLLFAALVMQVVVRIAVIERGYAYQREVETALNYDRELRRLKADLAVVTRPDLLNRESEQRLSFAPLSPAQIRRLQLGSRTSVEHSR